ncbi:HNH endonuclease [Aeromonas salmonicida]|uniref:HNH endonuclease n=1 Tax=Aeromonas salmonicida TaxID=645 RepID=UPI0038BA0722
MRSIAKQRHQAAIHQSFRCFYCGLPMWESSSTTFINRHGLTKAEASLLQCTGEHLHPKGEGGSDKSHNIVAACKHCNQTRHKSAKILTSTDYKKKVQKRLHKGAWFPESVIRKAKGKRTTAV